MKDGTSTSSSGSLAVAEADGSSDDENEEYDDPAGAGGGAGGAGGSVAGRGLGRRVLGRGVRVRRPKPEASRRAASGVRGGGAVYGMEYDGAAGGRVPAWCAVAGAGCAGELLATNPFESGVVPGTLPVFCGGEAEAGRSRWTTAAPNRTPSAPASCAWACRPRTRPR